MIIQGRKMNMLTLDYIKLKLSLKVSNSPHTDINASVRPTLKTANQAT